MTRHRRNPRSRRRSADENLLRCSLSHRRAPARDDAGGNACEAMQGAPAPRFAPSFVFGRARTIRAFVTVRPRRVNGPGRRRRSGWRRAREATPGRARRPEPGRSSATVRGGGGVRRKGRVFHGHGLRSSNEGPPSGRREPRPSLRLTSPARPGRREAETQACGAHCRDASGAGGPEWPLQDDLLPCARKPQAGRSPARGHSCSPRDFGSSLPEGSIRPGPGPAGGRGRRRPAPSSRG